MKNIDYRVYSTGEVHLLFKSYYHDGNSSYGVKEIKRTFFRNCFFDILYKIIRNFQTLTLENFQIKIKQINKDIYGKNLEEYKDYKNIIKVLFNEELDMMPLYINDPITGLIAKWRLEIGK